jgi:hypothetical protein
MAKSKTARRGGAKKAARKGGSASKARRASPKRTAKKAAGRKSTARGKAKSAKRASGKVAKRSSSKAAKRPQVRAAARKTISKPVKTTAKRAAVDTAGPARRPPTLDRPRRTAAETEMVPSPPSSLDMNRRASAARSGRHELAEKLAQHTSTGPAMTAGDIDADWEAAESVGDEAPGGDNPTPDQDVVDEIGKAVGIEYDDDEELQGGDEIVARDRNRWELDPASREDFEDE